MEKLAAKFVRVYPTLWRKARVKALSQEMTMQDLVSKLLKGYLKEAK